MKKLDYPKIVKTVPVEKREMLSDKMIDLILKSKNSDKMPVGLIKNILFNWQKGHLSGDAGLSALIEAGVLLEANKAVKILEQELQLMDAAKIIKEVLRN